MGKGDLVPRIITDFAVRLGAGPEGAFRAAHPVNLSETGLCVRTDFALEPDTVLPLAIEIAPDQPVWALSGRVVWVREDTLNQVFYCGLGFVEMTAAQRQAIQHYVEGGAESLLAFLSEFPGFAELDQYDCRSLLRITTLRSLERGEILYYEGTHDLDLQGLFIVQSGLLSIFKGDRHRPESQLAVVSPGQVFGEVTLVTEQAHTASVKAVNPSTLIQINKLGFRLLRREEPALALRLMDVVCHALIARLGRTTQKLFSPIHLGN